jgi:site-specific DNA recombinase
MRVAIYARVSSEQQAQHQTIESQLAALRNRVGADGYVLLPQDRYVDDGVSGSTLVRPALERLRDRVAEGAIDILYVHSPDRLARKYAYQVLLLEEFRGRGTEIIFLQGPKGQSAEDELLVQVQGMIAEYERAKIVERGRRGRLFRARQGLVNALGRAPFGYSYCPKSDTVPASFQIVLHEAKVVRSIFEALVREQKSIQAIVRTLNTSGVKPRCGGQWTRSTVGQMLRNSTYMGKAAFGKRQSIDRAPTRLRPMRGKTLPRSKGLQRRPPEEWVTIDVPPILAPELYEAALEQLARNRQLSPRRAVPRRYLLQGLTACARCEYAFYGTTVTKKGRPSYGYYRCSGADAWRFPGGRVCQVPPVRADLLDEHVWRSVCQLLREPERLKEEWSRRLRDPQASGNAFQAQRDEAARLVDVQERTLKRLVDAYEVGALNLAELQRRTNTIRTRIERAKRDLKSAQDKFDETVHLRAIITRLEDFSTRVGTRLEKVTWLERQRLIRMLVSKVAISDDGATIVYRLSPSTDGTPPPVPQGDGPGTRNGSYALCPSQHRSLPVEQPT